MCVFTLSANATGFSADVKSQDLPNAFRGVRLHTLPSVRAKDAVPVAEVVAAALRANTAPVAATQRAPGPLQHVTETPSIHHKQTEQTLGNTCRWDNANMCWGH